MKDINWFYKTIQWQNCRNAFIKSKGGLCERCLANGRFTPAEIAHHIIHLNAHNINDPTITLNWDNLQALCRDCHAEVHTGKRYVIDSTGRIITHN